MGSHHFGVLYAALPCPFTQEAVSRTWTRDFSVTWRNHFTVSPRLLLTGSIINLVLIFKIMIRTRSLWWFLLDYLHYSIPSRTIYFSKIVVINISNTVKTNDKQLSHQIAENRGTVNYKTALELSYLIRQRYLSWNIPNDNRILTDIAPRYVTRRNELLPIFCKLNI